MADDRPGRARPGLKEFLLGTLMILLSGYVLSDAMKISGGLWRAFGLDTRGTFALAMLLSSVGWPLRTSSAADEPVDGAYGR